MTLVIRNDQSVEFKPVFVDAYGNVADQLGSAPAWSLSEETFGSLLVAEDKMSAIFVPNGVKGTAVVNLLIDADPAADVEVELWGSAEVTVLSGMAVSVRLEGVLVAKPELTPEPTETPAPTEAPEPTFQPEGTLLSTTCIGVEKHGTYADGQGGTTTAVIDAQSVDCGFVAPEETPEPTPEPTEEPVETPEPTEAPEPTETPAPTEAPAQ